MDSDERKRALEDLDRLREEGIQLAVFSDPHEETIDSETMTVSDAMNLLKRIAELERDNSEPIPARGQWAKGLGTYTMIGDTVPELPPGYYDLATENNRLMFVPVPRRTDHILRFPHAETTTVMEEIEKFWAREDLFREFGVPYKRGILLYGPPGSGKTSALQLIARDVVERGGIVIIFDADLFPQAYRQVRRIQPMVPIVVLMEDLDAILATRNESTTLNLLDGAESMHKVVFVATTNYPEKLGPRIINRPSRFDKRVRVPHPDDVGRRMYVKALAGEHEPDLDLERYVRDTRGMSLAHLKELFVATVLIGTPYEDALKHLREMHLDRASSLDDDREFPSLDERSYL